jgi:hypothetical protein
MSDVIEQIQGSYNAAPGTLVQGAALQVEDLSTVMENVCFQDKALILQKMLKIESCKSTLAQFDRQLSYGIFGGSAQIEGGIGQEEVSDFVRCTVPMAYYSHTRRVTIVANMVATVDGIKAEERAASDAAKKLAGDVEFDCFRGLADFSNGGVFDGNPLSVATLPNMHGLDLQIRQSDSQRQTRDLMFAEFGSDDSVVISGGGTMTQDMIEDAHVRSAMNHGNAEKLVVDPKVLSAYNKLVFAKERIVLSGSAQGNTGGDLRKQYVSNGTVDIEASRFLSGKTRPAPTRALGPSAPTFSTTTPNASEAVSGAVTAFTAGQVYIYRVTAGTEVGESVPAAAYSVTIGTTGDGVVLNITAGSGISRYYNVYRTLAGGAVGSEKYIGRVNNTGTVSFTDLGNKLPGFVTGFLLEGDTMVLKELAPYSRLKLAVVDLSQPEASFRFLSLAVLQPRKNALIDNLR